MNSPASTCTTSPRSSQPRSSMKAKHHIIVTDHSDASSKGSSYASVRFLEPKPVARAQSRTAPNTKRARRPEPLISQAPSPLARLQYHHPEYHYPASGSGRFSLGSPLFPTPSRCSPLPRSPVRPRTSHLHVRPSRSTKRPKSSRPATATHQDNGWAPVPLPRHYSLPIRSPGTRSASYESTSSAGSGLSTQSAPTILLESAEPPTPPGIYNPLQNYIPCLYPSCSAHYTLAHAAPAYYAPSGLYSFAHLHGYCPWHATRELRDSNNKIKREWEISRQHAGRKTLNEITADFDCMLATFRADRQARDTRLELELHKRIAGLEPPASSTPHTPAATPTTATHPQNIDRQDDKSTTWDWRYTPRQCIKSSCTSAPYSPFANHLFAFYTTRRPSTFTPLRTMCPTCATADVEAFEKSVTEKWCDEYGWGEEERSEWISNAIKDRRMEQEFWERAQERSVREKGPPRIETLEVVHEVTQAKNVKKEGRKSVFRRFLASVAG